MELDVMELGWTRRRIVVTGRETSTVNQTYGCRLTSLEAHRSPIVTAILHDRTECGADTLSHQFTNCLHRLKLTLNDAHLLPGAGRTESRCIHSIQQTIEQWSNGNTSQVHSQVSTLPCSSVLPNSANWMSFDKELIYEWKLEVYRAFVSGLKRYLVRVELNSEPGEGYAIAITTVQSKIESCCSGKSQCEEMLPRKQLPGRPSVLDVHRSKKESWKRVLQLLRTVFLSKQI